MQLDRLSREEERSERISGSHSCGCSHMISRFVTENRASHPVELDRLSKDDPMAEAFARLFLREKEREERREREKERHREREREGDLS